MSGLYASDGRTVCYVKYNSIHLLIKTKWGTSNTCAGLRSSRGRIIAAQECTPLGLFYVELPHSREAVLFTCHQRAANSTCWHELEMSINLSANEKGEGFSSLQMNWNRCSVSPRSLIKTTQDSYLFYMKKSFTCVWKLYGNIAF